MMNIIRGLENLDIINTKMDLKNGITDSYIKTCQNTLAAFHDTVKNIEEKILTKEQEYNKMYEKVKEELTVEFNNKFQNIERALTKKLEEKTTNNGTQGWNIQEEQMREIAYNEFYEAWSKEKPKLKAELSNDRKLEKGFEYEICIINQIPVQHRFDITYKELQDMRKAQVLARLQEYEINLKSTYEITNVRMSPQYQKVNGQYPGRWEIQWNTIEAVKDIVAQAKAANIGEIRKNRTPDSRRNDAYWREEAKQRNISDFENNETGAPLTTTHLSKLGMCDTQYIKKVENSTIPEEKRYNHLKQTMESSKRSRGRYHNGGAQRIFNQIARDNRQFNGKVQGLAQNFDKHFSATSTNQGFQRNMTRQGRFSTGNSRPRSVRPRGNPSFRGHREFNNTQNNDPFTLNTNNPFNNPAFMRSSSTSSQHNLDQNTNNDPVVITIDQSTQ